MTQKQVARAIDVTLRTVSKWEKDKRVPSGVELAKFAEVVKSSANHAARLLLDQDATR